MSTSLLSRISAMTRSDAPSEDLRKEMESDKERTKGGAGRFKIPEDGKPHAVRVLPGLYGKSGKKFYAPLVQHWIGGGKEQDSPFYCMDFHFDKPCPACEALAETRRREQTFTGSDEDAKDLAALIKKLLPQNSWALNVVSRAEIQEGAVPPVHLYTCPRTVFQFIESTYANEGPQILDIIDGHDFIIERSKDPKTGRTVYKPSISLKAKPISEDVDILEDMLAKMVDLDKLITMPKVDEFETVVLETIKAIGPEEKRHGHSRREQEPGQESRRESPRTREPDPEPEQVRTREPDPEQQAREPDAKPARGGGLYAKLRAASAEE